MSSSFGVELVKKLSRASAFIPRNTLGSRERIKKWRKGERAREREEREREREKLKMFVRMGLREYGPGCECVRA